MSKSRVDPLLVAGAVVALALLALAWTRLPGSERPILLPLSVSSLALGGLVALLGGLEREHRPVADATAQALVLQAGVAAAALAFGWDLMRALTVAVGLGLVVTGNATARARPGLWFGFRTRWTLLSERAWYATQREAARALVTVGLVYAAFAALTPAALLVPWVIPVGLVVLLLPVVVGLHRLSYREYLADSERRPAVAGARQHLPAYSASERVLLGVAVGLPLLSLAALLILLPSLPEQVPLHFNAAGEADRFGSPLELLTLPLIGLGLTALLWASSRFGSATPAQRHVTLVMAALGGAFVAPLALGSTGSMHVTLGAAHALMLVVLALAFALPGPDGKRRVRAAWVCGGLALALVPLLLFLPPRGAEAVGGLLLVFGGMMFLAPMFVFGVPMNTGWPQRKPESES
ncbi:DUF1648 domain-containing protein [Deinococcus sp. SDU3-2]|uniref:DUF1648 domain-containing protein n=1 Tax=Deinococcus terrestris TaxID=2651870 RepID=A0A7X1NUF2_9DEIO|nr:DUF1648 domain-containing protein [Deinococcus terrestris]MPY65900.1 DUF1648 domain-containing protein [Deinococcus terrestris]